MKRDSFGCLIREKYIDGHPGNLGDSCAETCRALILLNGSNPMDLKFWVFNPHYGQFVRHPQLDGKPGWGTEDFVNDQYLPLLLQYDRACASGTKYMRPGLFIPGTKTLVSPGAWAASRGYFALLNVFNLIQGLLFHLRWRWSDDERFKGKFWKLERSEGKVQDWLNYVIVFVYLQQIGKWCTLNQPVDRIMKNIRTYYLEGDDWEPNSRWIVELYEMALGVRGG